MNSFFDDNNFGGTEESQTKGSQESLEPHEPKGLQESLEPQELKESQESFSFGDFGEEKTAIKKKNRGRILNFRGFFVVAIFVLAAIFFALVAANIPALGYTLFALQLILAAALTAFYTLKTKKIDRAFSFFLAFIISITAFSLFLTTNAGFIHDTDYTKSISLTGMVERDFELDGTRRIYLKELALDGKSVKGGAVLYINGTYVADSDTGFGAENQFSSGTIITVVTKLKPKYLLDGYSADGAPYRSNVRYSATVRLEGIEVLGSRNAGFFVKIHNSILKKLVGGLGEKYGTLTYGMLTGDKRMLDGQVKNYFSAAGLYHILTISGLQLGFVAAFVTFLLKKLRLRRGVIGAITTFVLFFYVFVAGFSPSVMRAALCSALGVWVFLFGHRRDALSALCLAFSLIAGFAPFYLFEAGFILSVCCCFGIIVFFQPIYRFLMGLFGGRGREFATAAACNSNTVTKSEIIYDDDNDDDDIDDDGDLEVDEQNELIIAADLSKKLRRQNKLLSTAGGNETCVNEYENRVWQKIYRYIIATLSMSISVQLGGLPALIFIFYRLQIYSIPTNVFLMPLIALVFLSSLIILLLSFIIPPLIVLFKIDIFGLKAIDFVAESVARLPFSTIVIYATTAIFAIYALYFVCSRFVMLRKKWHIRLVSVLLAVTLIFVQNPTVAGKGSVVPVDSGGAVTYINVEGRDCLVGDIWSSYLVQGRLSDLKIRNIDAVFIDRMDYSMAIQLQNLALIYVGLTVYYPLDNPLDKDTARELKNIKTAPYLLETGENVAENTVKVDLGGGFDAIFVGGRLRAYGLNTDDVSILMPLGNYRYDRLSIIGEYSVIRAASYYDAGSKLYLLGEVDDMGNESGEEGDEDERYGVYTWKNQPYIYNYKTHGFMNLDFS